MGATAVLMHPASPSVAHHQFHWALERHRKKYVLACAAASAAAWVLQGRVCSGLQSLNSNHCVERAGGYSL